MNKICKEQGSIVVESSIIMPFFLAFVIAMISFVQIAVAEMALHSSVSETVKQISTQYYPIYVLSQSEQRKKLQSLKLSEITPENLKETDQFSGDYSTFIPEFLQNMFLDQKGYMNSIQSEANLFIARKSVLPILRLFTDDKMLNPTNLEVIDVTLSSMNDKKASFFGITASYKLKLFIPFMHRELDIRQTAIERVWIGD